MGRNSKWIDSEPRDSVRKIARRALEARLERVWYFLELAMRQPRSETENVHQLRVFARRAAAALETFEACLPPRRGRWMQKQVKRIRKAAGEARDLDVLWMRWVDRIGQMPSDQAALLLARVKLQRRNAQRPIDKVLKKLVRKRFRRKTAKFLRRLRGRGDNAACNEPFACMARVALGRLVAPYLCAAAAEMSDAEALHKFRIQGKQVRYAMEIFAGAFDADFRHELYPIVAALQDRLGAINDHVTAEKYLTQWRDETDSCALRQALDMGLSHEQHSRELARQEFLAWWTPQRREDLSGRFARYVQVESACEAPSARDVDQGPSA